MSDDRILLAVDAPIATITLNRPDKLHAIDPPMLSRLEEIVREIDGALDIHVVILTATGDRAFCVGADINAWSALPPLDMWRRWVRTGHRVLDELARLRQPTIAALNGLTLGGGLELALACDLRLAADHVELGSPEVKIGTLPGWAGTRRLAALVGPARAKQLVLTGMRVNAATAAQWGLVNEVVPRADLMARVTALAREIASAAPVAVQLAKQAIDGALGDDPAALEAMAGALAAGTDDGREGIAAFREKRPPHFVNR